MRGAAALAESLRAHREEVLLYRTLATLRTDVPLAEDREALRYRGAARARLAELESVLGVFDLGRQLRMRPRKGEDDDAAPERRDGSEGDADVPRDEKPGRAVEEAWTLGAARVWLHTNSRDAPAALPNYLARGFRIVKAEFLEPS